ncbi:nickel/cobalt transporter [Effusibacillus dendaii]|uniref:Nickel/cobalt efflux system n=1 Tax=Effusibacillus dendaii TaxID=2743772 RepID=A0A7I8D6Y2_9BACL|nr:sulfite exporter TauE/SafE family protein [Effusibacillus dendaii]BCJ85757.1 nickel/cobalt efflux system [Effusibacillus dendaii]
MEWFYTIPAAVGLGALHSLEPGHGKGVLTAYLISSRAKVKDAILLGSISAIAHTLSILLLAFAASSTVKMFVPEQLSHWIELISGVLIVTLGSRMLYQQIRPRIVVVGTIGHIHDEQCEHHHHPHGMSRHLDDSAVANPNRLFLVGFLGGLIPCPSAIAILLAAVSAHQIPAGMMLVMAFSLGSALAMSTVGMLVVTAGQTVKWLANRQAVRLLSTLSSCLVVCLGFYVTFQSLLHLSII